MAESTAFASYHVRFHQAYVVLKETPDSEEAASRLGLVIASFLIAGHGQPQYPLEALVARKAVAPESWICPQSLLCVSSAYSNVYSDCQAQVFLFGPVGSYEEQEEGETN
jgi:hypothetical protein